MQKNPDDKERGTGEKCDATSLKTRPNNPRSRLTYTTQSARSTSKSADRDTYAVLVILGLEALRPLEFYVHSFSNHTPFTKSAYEPKGLIRRFR